MLLMSFECGRLLRSIDVIGAWNASQTAFSVAVIDLREDAVEGEPRPGLVLEIPAVAGNDLGAGGDDAQLARGPPEVVARLAESFRRHASGQHPHPPGASAGAADTEIFGLVPGALRELFGVTGKDAGIAAAEPIRILGRPDRIGDIGWAVLVHER